MTREVERPRPDGTDIRRAREEDRDAMAETLAAAFEDDPIARWITPGPRRHKVLRAAYRRTLQGLWLSHGACWTHVEPGVGVAVWLPPGTPPPRLRAQLRLLPFILRTYRFDARRLVRLVEATERVHPKSPHHYLAFLGVAPDHQGRGFGSQLLRPVLEQCDRTGSAAYLEASSERSKALYERHGFHQRGNEIRIADDAPPLWPMWRPPDRAAPRGRGRPSPPLPRG